MDLNLGTLRLILAIAVVFDHVCGALIINGKYAVEIFFIISGFLISFILVESQNYNQIKYFYINRFLRIYPLYLLILFSKFFLVIFLYIFFNTNSGLITLFDSVNIPAKLFIIFSNIFIFGQDILFFTAIDSGSLFFTSKFISSDLQIWWGLVVPPSWTLSLELMFYIIAPFVLRKIRVMILIFIISLLIKCLLCFNEIGLTAPWENRFFPAELSLFLFGALIHRFLYFKNQFAKKYDYIFYVFAIMGILFFQFINSSIILIYSFIFLISLTLPSLFRLQNKFLFDKKIGELSYPVYLIHSLVIWILLKLPLENFGYSYGSLGDAIIVIFITLLISFFTNKYFIKYFDNQRMKIKNNYKNLPN